MEKTPRKGTTTIGIICKDAVVIAADQLATMGDFQVSKDVSKIEPITKKIVMTTAGSVGDNQALVRFLKAQMTLYHLEDSEPTVNAVATLMSNILSDKYLYSYLPYQIYDLVGGYDSKPRLFAIDMVGGTTEEKKFSATGSGMMVAYGILDAEYNESLTSDQAVELAVKSIVAARKRVTSVGGDGITVYIITKTGAELLPSEKIKKIAAKF